MPSDPFPFDVVDDAFAHLMEARPTLALDRRRPDGTPPAPVAVIQLPVFQLRRVLLDRSVPFETRDAILAELLDRARQHRPEWRLVLVAVLLPGLRPAATRLARQGVAPLEDIQAEMMAGLLEAIGTCPPGRERIAARLIWAARRRGIQHVRTEAAARPRPLPDTVASRPDLPAGHPDFVLAAAVAEGVINAAEAELIATTRLEANEVRDVAQRLGLPYETVKKARQRAEERLVHYLQTGEHLVSRRRPPSALRLAQDNSPQTATGRRRRHAAAATSTSAPTGIANLRA